MPFESAPTRMTLDAYKKMANEVDAQLAHLNSDEIEELYLENLSKWSKSQEKCAFKIPVYAINNHISRYPNGWKFWNLNQLTSAESIIHGSSNTIHPGINATYINWSSAFCSFGWHIEDSCMGSINQHLGGANRTWYGIGSGNAADFEALVAENVPKNIECKTMFIRHKSILVPPNVLDSQGIQFCKVKRQFIFSFSRIKFNF